MSTFIIGLLVALWYFRLAAKHHAEGRQAFLLAQASLFDKSYANLHHPLVYVFVGVFIACAFVLTYEAVAFVLGGLMKRAGGRSTS